MRQPEWTPILSNILVRILDPIILNSDPLERSAGWLQVRDHQLTKTFHLKILSFRIYLEEGSKLCIAVIKRRTINAQTKFDLNTSSLI